MNRTETIRLTLTAEEKARIEAAAKAKSIPTAVYARYAALRETLSRPKVPPRAPELGDAPPVSQAS